MKVLVTGGTGVVGVAAVNALRSRGHAVRLFSRHAADDARQWADGVEPFNGNVADADAIRRAAGGCDALLHIAGIVTEAPPELTFDRVNVEGTRNAVAAAESAGARRFVYVSSLGADRGQSAYHRSKLAAEEIVRAYAREWVVVRPGNVYGPGDEVISLLLRMVRTLPTVPVVGRGDQRFQPIWHRDLAEVLVACVERADVAGRTLEVAGDEVVTPNEVIDALERITDRHPLRLPVPEFLARAGTDLLAGAVGAAPVPPELIEMLLEENVIRAPDGNAIRRDFHIDPVPLSEGLEELADAQPERLPAEGVGELERRVFRVDIRHPARSAADLGARFRSRFDDFVPVEAEAEPGTDSELVVGATVTLRLPARGHVQVRVEEASDVHMTMVTLTGHPLAGAVGFDFEQRGGDVRFTVEVLDRPASRVDQVALALGGAWLQARTWTRVCERVVEESGGEAPDGVQKEGETLRDVDAAIAEGRLEQLVMRRKRKQENARD